MSKIPNRVQERLTKGIKKYQGLIQKAKARDINESDTAIIMTDLLEELFGYHRYDEITSEYKVRSTFCDLAIKDKNKPKILIELKSVETELKDNNIKQATDYAANEGVDWVILSNLVHWKIYKVVFAKPIDNQLILDFDFLSLSAKNAEHLQWLFCLSKEGRKKDALEGLHDLCEATSRHTIGALLLSDPIVNLIRRELKRRMPSIKIDPEQITKVLENEVIKREIIDDKKTQQAMKRIKRVHKRNSKISKARKETGGNTLSKELKPLEKAVA